MLSALYTAAMVWLIWSEIALIWFIECATSGERGDD
jgi:hypothetical protein